MYFLFATKCNDVYLELFLIFGSLILSGSYMNSAQFFQFVKLSQFLSKFSSDPKLLNFETCQVLI